jgi:hypothetical protein
MPDLEDTATYFLPGEPAIPSMLSPARKDRDRQLLLEKTSFRAGRAVAGAKESG